MAQVLPLPDKPGQRVAALHPGAWEVGEDFDHPLTEEFVSGKA